MIIEFGTQIRIGEAVAVSDGKILGRAQVFARRLGDTAAGHTGQAGVRESDFPIQVSVRFMDPHFIFAQLARAIVVMEMKEVINDALRFKPILGDMVFWAKYGTHCHKLVTVNLMLAQYRWHGATQTVARAPSIDALIADEWRTMQEVEGLRARKPGLIRRMKLKGLMAVRSGIKAKRFGQLGNESYAREIVEKARGYTGRPLWLAGKTLVELRELVIFKIGGRPRQPQNIFS